MAEFLDSPLPLQYLRPQGYQPMQISRWHWHGDHIEGVSAQRGCGSPSSFVSDADLDGNFLMAVKRFISEAPATVILIISLARNVCVLVLVGRVSYGVIIV